MLTERHLNNQSIPGRCCDEPQTNHYPGRRGRSGNHSGCHFSDGSVRAASGGATGRSTDRRTKWYRSRRPVTESGGPVFPGLPTLFLLLAFMVVVSSGCGFWRRNEPRRKPETTVTSGQTRRQQSETSSRPVERSQPRTVVKHVYDPCSVPDSIECYLHRADQLVGLGDFSALKRIMLEAERLYPNNTSILTHIGLAYLRLHELPRARYYLERAVQLNPNSSRAIALLREVGQLMDIAPTSVVIWVQVWNKRIVKHSLITEVRGGLEVEQTEKRDGRVYITFIGKVRKGLRYTLVIPYLPDGQHYLTARRQ